MNSNRTELAYDWDRGIVDEMELSVPGVSGTISLAEECWCVDFECDTDDGQYFYSAIKDCSDCHGTGIRITENGKAILKLIELDKNRNIF